MLQQYVDFSANFNWRDQLHIQISQVASPTDAAPPVDRGGPVAELLHTHQPHGLVPALEQWKLPLTDKTAAIVSIHHCIPALSETETQVRRGPQALGLGVLCNDYGGFKCR